MIVISVILVNIEVKALLIRKHSLSSDTAVNTVTKATGAGTNLLLMALVWKLGKSDGPC